MQLIVAVTAVVAMAILPESAVSEESPLFEGQGAILLPVADQGFPVGGADPLGGADLRCVHFLAKTYAKMKEMDPVGGRGERAQAAPPGSANGYCF